MTSVIEVRKSNSMPLGIRNVGFLVDRMGEDCHPLQFVRELTQNSIQSIQKSGREGVIIWDADSAIFKRTGVYKLSITDNGLGMDAEELIAHISHLSSSGGIQAIDKNFGIGAKIATFPRNPEGVIYQSWKNGIGNMIQVFRDAETGEYGLKQFDLHDGNFSYVMPISDEMKPKEIGGSGTKVILLGTGPADNTMVPSSIPLSKVWILRYLNTRYLKFPKGISVKARQFWDEPGASNGNTMRTVKGHEQYLNSSSVFRGIVELSKANVHWWLLKDGDKNNSGYFASSGHVAAIFQDELYDLQSGRAAMARLQEFGIIFGCRSVVLYVEPLSLPAIKLGTNSARTQLLINNRELPWTDWAIEFGSKMPTELSKFVKSKSEALLGKDHGKSIRDRLKPYLGFFSLTKYRAAPAGKRQLDDSQIEAGASEIGKSHDGGQASSGNKSAILSSSLNNIYSLFEKREGPSAQEIQLAVFPERSWIRKSDGTRAENQLEDRAAHYISSQNRLLINADFRGFVSIIEKIFTDQFDSNPQVKPVIEQVVQSWVELMLVEIVLGVKSLSGSREWSQDSVGKALSEEALTAAIMQRYHLVININRELGSKLGSKGAVQKLKDQSAEG